MRYLVSQAREKGSYLEPATFVAIARNDAGLTFQFRFRNLNWNGAEAAAYEALALMVRNDALHQANRPWHVLSYDVAA